MSHGTNNLVISCMDYRFRERTAAWITENVSGGADLVSVAGAAKAITDNVSREYIFSLIDIGIRLHGVKTVHILNHIDCGAYGGSGQHENEGAEKEFHRKECEQARELLLKKFPDLEVEIYFMDWDQTKSC